MEEKNKVMTKYAHHSMNIDDLQATALSINYSGQYLLLAGEILKIF
jgi:hypothetical protein